MNFMETAGESIQKQQIEEAKRAMRLAALQNDPIGSAERENKVNVAFWGAEGQKGAGSARAAVDAAGTGNNEEAARPQQAALAALREQSETGRTGMREAGANTRTGAEQIGANFRTAAEQTGANTRTGVEQNGANFRTAAEQTGANWRTTTQEAGATNRMGMEQTGATTRADASNATTLAVADGRNAVDREGNVISGLTGLANGYRASSDLMGQLAERGGFRASPQPSGEVPPARTIDMAQLRALNPGVSDDELRAQAQADGWTVR